ncbi:LOW QUALITY PROTEIN: hypothetical protein U0070_007364, partial [Myodes glareolus]
LSSQQNGKLKSNHKDDPSKSVHLPANLGYKVCMAQNIQGEQERSQRNCNHCENNTHGSCGHCGRYVETPQGLQTFKTVFAEQTNEKCKRCCYKTGTNLRRPSPNTGNMGKKQLEKYLNSMIKYSQVLYITEGSQKILLPLYQKALWMEQRQKGVSSHWHPKKSTLQDPLRAVQGYLYWSLEPCPCGLLCGSSWAERLPSSHRDKLDLQDWSKSLIRNNVSTDYYSSDKSIKPLGNFIHYDEVINDFVRLKGCVVGTKNGVQFQQLWRKLTWNLLSPIPSLVMVIYRLWSIRKSVLGHARNTTLPRRKMLNIGSTLCYLFNFLAP